MTNMGGRRLSVNVASLTGEIPIKSVSQKRLFYLDGLVKFEDNVAHTDATSIPIDVEETTIVTIELTEPLAIAGTLEKKSHYAAGTAIKSVAASKDGFAIRVDDTGSVQSAKLIVGVQRKGGLGGPLSGTFNGKPFKVKAAWASEFNNLFASIDVKLPIALLAADNTLKIDQRDGLTITSVHIETEK